MIIWNQKHRQTIPYNETARSKLYVIMLPMSKLLPCRLLLIFALLFVQVGGLAHGIAHTLAQQEHNLAQQQEQSSEPSLPHVKHCDLCVAYGQVGDALSSHAIHFAGNINGGTLYFSPFYFHPSTAPVVFLARAPPYSA